MDDERSAFQEEFIRLAVVEGIGPDYAESYYSMLPTWPIQSLGQSSQAMWKCARTIDEHPVGEF